MRQDWLQPFLEQSLDAIIVVDRNGSVCEWSGQAQAMFGWSKEEAVGRKMAELIIPKTDRQAHWVGLKTYNEFGIGPVINRRSHLKALTKDQRIIDVELTVVPVNVGETELFVGTVRDRLYPSDRPTGESSADSKKTPDFLTSGDVIFTAMSEEDSRAIEGVFQDCLKSIIKLIDWPVGVGLILDTLGRLLPEACVWYSPDPDLQERFDSHGIKSAEHVPLGSHSGRKPVWSSQEAAEKQFPFSEIESPPMRTVLTLPVIADGHLAAYVQFYHWEEIAEDSRLISSVRNELKPLQELLERRRWQELKSYLAAIVESSNDAIIGKDRFGTIVSWNHGAERVYGYTEREAIGKTVQLILPEGTLEEEEEIRDVVQSGRRLASFETVRKHKNGSLLDISLSISPVRDSQGRLIGSATIERDITPLKRTIRELYDREEKLRLLMEASGEAIYGIDPDGRCTFANRACARVLGFESAEELLGEKMHKLVHHSYEDGGNYPQDLCPINQTLMYGKSVHVNNEVFWRKDGTSFPVEYWASPVRRGSNVVGAVVVFEDATDRIIAERTRAELAAIVESSADAIIGKALDGTIKSWNQGASQLYGYESDEVIGQNYTALLCAEDDQMPKPVDVSEQDWNVSTFEVTRIDRNGNQIEVGITESGILDSEGRLIGTASIERDISSRKRRETELEEARHAAEVANKTKSEFVANISHELRTPMNAVLGMLRIVLEEPLPQALRDYLGTAKDSAETLLLILDDLLDFSRMEAGKFELDPEPFRLRETVENSVKALANRAHQKGLELTFDVDGSVPDRLEGDGFRLRQVLVNLTGNAIKFTDHGEIVVTVTSKMIDDDTVVIEFTVEDTGVGIPEGDLERIFEPFTQVDSSMTRSRTGSGLGLSICRELIQKMGGEISVASQVGKGTTFRFTSQFRVISVVEESFDTTHLSGHRAVIIDDNLTNLRVVSKRLADWGMEVLATGGQDETEEIWRSISEANLPSVAIIDSSENGTSSLDLIAKAREYGVMCPFILMVSPRNRLFLERLTRRFDICSLIEKPVTGSDLFDAIMGVLNREIAERKVADPKAPLKAARALNLLVAEDTPANQKVVRAIFERRGHNISVVQNGREALEAVQQEKLDAVLMDVQMPEMDGLQATGLIRKMDPPLGKIPIIAMTAHARREDRRRCLAAGMSGYVSKPIQAFKLIRLVERLVSDQEKSYPRSAPLDVPTPAEEPVERSTMSEVPKFNLAIALERMGGDQEILDEMIKAFLEDAPVLLQEVHTARSENDWSDLRRGAHSLKGLAANFEALPVVESA
ncbi:Signal transduction histidine-protein kinase BarA [Thalassoglobus neptunius]|uniref:Sensory/regulatory protein RpfC n=1 Tax=Thalassoglobus neptunius TaxID=1938619 RepID=A0A5C5XB79_9PLAN|nr:PAS domain S-box protein [Thalassoglobus neptunius]TWT59152.1 Signal transduction histidine-protein kinase BarA [Thalassoglobus neptunius]